MSAELTILQAGPSFSIQDMGRPGYRSRGMTIGGGADRTALHEGAALLGQSPDQAALEMAVSGGQFTANQPVRIALTGAVMAARIGDEPIAWNASHLLPAGAVLTIGGASCGNYGYLHLGGGIDTPAIMGAKSCHFAAGIGRAVQSGDILALGTDDGANGIGNCLPAPERLQAGRVRFVSSMQTDAFSDETFARFTGTQFRRDARANRMGVRLDSDAGGLFAENQLGLVSEVVVPGDIQVAGDGCPFVLMYECQTTGGYPRIGTVIPCDIPIVAQLAARSELRFEHISRDDAVAAQTRHQAELNGLPGQVAPLLRDPATIRDLLGYQLISGAVSAHENPYQTQED